MCGIICGISHRDVSQALVEGLKRLEYRGYDSAGIAVINGTHEILRTRTVGKVEALRNLIESEPVAGKVGIAHTRWATHGAPETRNAHPHVSSGRIAVVHNGIIENHEVLRGFLIDHGYEFSSDTDSEVIAHLIDHYIRKEDSLLGAVQRSVTHLEGAFTIGAVCVDTPDRLVAARQGTPLVIGLASDETFAASDTYALLPLASRFVFLEDGDTVEIRSSEYSIFDRTGRWVSRPVDEITYQGNSVGKDGFRHYMLKEIFEQPEAITRTLQNWVQEGKLAEHRLSNAAQAMLDNTNAVDIIACGTSYHAGMIARYWFEQLGIPCSVEVASEHRYRDHVTSAKTLLVTISQSGETADTIAALRQARHKPHCGAVCICNVPSSTLVRESDFTMLTEAGPEIGVASTKAFTTQLAALRLLTLFLAIRQGQPPELIHEALEELETLPDLMHGILARRSDFETAARFFQGATSALFLGRGLQYPIAREGALKLKEISYIHAEAYPAGELKHGPLALVDSSMLVVCTQPFDRLATKTLSNIKEVLARGGRVLLFTDDRVEVFDDPNLKRFRIGKIPDSTAPMAFVLPLQLLAYEVAVQRGADVDQPRNLAKSVTVE